MVTERQRLESELTELLRERAFERAATLALRGYGTEIFSLLAALHENEQDADDAFSIFCEHLWRWLPGFQGRSSLRTWAYKIARRASYRVREQKRAHREEPVTGGEFAELAAAVRTSTWTQLRRERRTRLRELRRTLDPDDQVLLILRVERELDWKDLARVMKGDDELEDEALTREAARLRKRFQLVKDRLKELVAS